MFTTPKYYFSRSQPWDPRRFIGRMGGGSAVDGMIGMITYGHHWKEYSAGVFSRYFSLMPCAMQVTDMRYINVNEHHRAVPRGLIDRGLNFLARRIGILRDATYAGIEPRCSHPSLRKS